MFASAALQILLEPLVLNVLAPVADIPFAPRAKLAERGFARIDRHMQYAKTLMGVSLFESSLEFVCCPAAVNCLHARDRRRKLDVIDCDRIVGAEFLAVLRKLQAGDGSHPAIVENHHQAMPAEYARIAQNLQIQHEGALAGEC